ncbi:hypothetical protein SUGI_0306640 [Cryptomeria japonica]|uniref:disease resistance protein RUN1 isoform X1 n=1 Tax=Cryptomeria japonica TaxID=3369 RepID=UPI002408DDAD|nr:disease resistance protein RUN1 isoform X1 [Cryptomeria japonica]GLJ17610.1 hypothetical protein SUGI_0306640 [Cryptomeria japonica]
MEDFKHYRPLSSQTLIHREKRYHIFLSFRGADVRKTLVDHLYQSLSTAGLNVFLDSERLEKGDSIGISLQRAIQSSAIHIPIFSAHYALSPWCLKELSLMWDFKSISTGTTIIPLFYNVEPSDVRYPDKKGGPYAEAFHKHYTQGRHEHHEITAWKAALFQVSSLSGWSLTETALGYEGRLVKQVVTDVLKTLNVTVLDVAKRPVGLKARTEEVIKLLKIDDSRADRLIVGIWGMGGLGKSTLAKAIYNEIHHLFEASSFASEVRATAGESTKGLRKLQQHVLQDLMKAEMKLKSADQGKMVMRNCLASIRALVILDDVSDEKQVDALVGDWYGQGSRIIITSRDKSILEAGQVDAIYHMNGLDIEESTQLFSWHAFLRACPDKGYKDMTERIVKACRGLPLSLEIIGAHLYGKRNIRYWSDALTKIENVEYEKIYQTLKISYDALPVQEKRIFLDIACFFITLKLQDGIFSSKRAYNMDFYIKFWGVLGCRAVYTSLQNLEGKSLIVIQEHKYNESEDEDQNDELGPYFCEFSMHNQIRDLGRRMVEEESWDDPAQRSRVWREEDIFNVLARKEEMSSVRGVMWKRYLELQGIDSLQAMHNLEFMLWWDLHLRTQITIFPLNLRYLVLSNCQLEECEPCLEMPETESDSDSNGSSLFSTVLPKSIAQLKLLRYLDLSRTKQSCLPKEFGELLYLEELYLFSCCLEALPQTFGNLVNLNTLDISNNLLSKIPSSFKYLKSLAYLKAARNSELVELLCLPRGIINLNVKQCLKLEKFSIMSSMPKLDALDLSHCHSLAQISSLDLAESLKRLKLDGCKKLVDLTDLPEGLICLDISGCSQLQKFSSVTQVKRLNVMIFEENPGICKSMEPCDYDCLPSPRPHIEHFLAPKIKSLQRLCMADCDSFDINIYHLLKELPYLEQLEVSGSPADELPTEMYPLVGGLSVPVQRETRCEAILFCFVLCSKENVRVPEMRVETTMLTADTNCSPFKNFKLPSYSVANDKEKNILRICVYKGATRFKFVTGDVISCSFTVPEQFAQQGSLVRHIELLYLEGEKEDMNSQNATRFLHQWKLNVS